MEAEWIGESPGHLPWWRLGRPPASEAEDPEVAVQERRRLEAEGPEWRPRLAADDLVARCADALEVDLESLRSRQRAPELVRARELIMVLGAERYRQRVRDLAAALAKSRDGTSHVLARGLRRRTDDERFRADLDNLDQLVTRMG